MDSSMQYEAWNWHNFRLTGDDKQFRVNVSGDSPTAPMEYSGVSVAFRCEHFYINGYDLVDAVVRQGNHNTSVTIMQDFSIPFEDGHQSYRGTGQYYPR